MYLNAEQVADLFKVIDGGQVYRKSGEMLARPANTKTTD